MTLTKAIRIGIVTCALIWVGFMMVPDSLQWIVPGLWSLTLPLAGCVLAVAAGQSVCSKATLWAWTIVLVLLPSVSIGYVISMQLGITWGMAIRPFGPLDSLAALAIITSTAWPAMLIVLLYLLKWTSAQSENATQPPLQA